MSEVPVVCGKSYILLRLRSKLVYSSEKGCIFYFVEFTKNKISLRD